MNVCVRGYRRVKDACVCTCDRVVLVLKSKPDDSVSKGLIARDCICTVAEVKAGEISKSQVGFSRSSRN